MVTTSRRLAIGVLATLAQQWRADEEGQIENRAISDEESRRWGAEADVTYFGALDAIVVLLKDRAVYHYRLRRLAEQAGVTRGEAAEWLEDFADDWQARDMA